MRNSNASYDILSGMEKMRTYLILDYLRQHKRCTLGELMERFGVSSATIHRDVDELARRDAIMKVRGGLVFNEKNARMVNGADFSERIVTNRGAKIAAAEKALSHISEGDIIFLDSSTTVYELSLLLRSSDLTHLTVITNSVSIIQNFRKFPSDFVLIGLGGSYDAQLNSFLGETVVGQLAQLNITKAFVSAFGLDARHATTNHENQAMLLRKVIASSARNYLVIDDSKLDRTGLHRIAARSAFDAILISPASRSPRSGSAAGS